MSADTIVYLDNNATTRVAPSVRDAMLPYLDELYGNSSSLHHFGARVAAEIEQARGQLAKLIHARESEIVFTSGGTEADNTALHGVLSARPSKRQVIISAVEHHAILEPAERLHQHDVDVTKIGVDRAGRLDLEALGAAIRDDTALVSVMLANNETGMVYPLREIAELAHARGVLVHTDAVNALGKHPVDFEALGVDLMSLSAHKMHGPKGVGALVIRRGTPFQPRQIGGPQERDRRGGTHNAPGIIGFGAAATLWLNADETVAMHARVHALRDELERRLLASCPRAHVIGIAAERLGNTSCICFDGVEAEPVLLLLSERGICASSGAACASGSLEPSHVLKAMAIPPEIAQGQIRFSLSRYTTHDDIDRVVAALPEVLAKVASVNVG